MEQSAGWLEQTKALIPGCPIVTVSYNTTVEGGTSYFGKMTVSYHAHTHHLGLTYLLGVACLGIGAKRPDLRPNATLSPTRHTGHEDLLHMPGLSPEVMDHKWDVILVDAPPGFKPEQ